MKLTTILLCSGRPSPRHSAMGLCTHSSKDFDEPPPNITATPLEMRLLEDLKRDMDEYLRLDVEELRDILEYIKKYDINNEVL